MRHFRRVFRGTATRCPIAAAIICIAMTACSKTDTEAPSKTHAGRNRPTNPLATVGQVAGIEAAGLTGNQRSTRGHVDAMQENLMRSMCDLSPNGSRARQTRSMVSMLRYWPSPTITADCRGRSMRRIACLDAAYGSAGSVVVDRTGDRADRTPGPGRHRLLRTPIAAFATAR